MNIRIMQRRSTRAIRASVVIHASGTVQSVFVRGATRNKNIKELNFFVNAMSDVQNMCSHPSNNIVDSFYFLLSSFLTTIFRSFNSEKRVNIFLQLLDF